MPQSRAFVNRRGAERTVLCAEQAGVYPGMFLLSHACKTHGFAVN